MGSNVCLTNDPFALEWMDSHQIQARRNASLGDASNFHGDAYNSIQRAHTALAEGLGTIAKLVKDPTKTEVVKHEVAERVANHVVGTLEQSASVFRSISAALANQANEAIADAFAIDEKRIGIHAEIREWIRQTAKVEGGLQTIRKEMTADAEIAAVIFQRQHFLLGLAPEARDRLLSDAIEKHVPKAGEKVAQADDLAALAIRYGQLGKAVRRSFYNPQMAAQAKLRVEFA